jgi:hypothetical protein
MLTRGNVRRSLVFLAATTFVLLCDTRRPSAVDGFGSLALVQTIPLSGVAGRIDHLGLDAQRKRLFVAGLGNNTVEVVDLVLGQVIQRIQSLSNPQGIGIALKSNRIGVANDQDGSFRLYDGTSLRQTAVVYLKEDADNVRYDTSSHRFWVGYGKAG